MGKRTYTGVIFTIETDSDEMFAAFSLELAHLEIQIRLEGGRALPLDNVAMGYLVDRHEQVLARLGALRTRKEENR